METDEVIKLVDNIYKVSLLRFIINFCLHCTLHFVSFGNCKMNTLSASVSLESIHSEKILHNNSQY